MSDENNTTSVEGTETVVEDSAVETNTTNETTQQTNTEPTLEEQVQELEQELLSIDELLNLNNEDVEEFTEDANYKGMKPLHHWMQNVPEDVRKHLANLRSSYTRKTQELAQQRKEIEQIKEKMFQQNDRIANNPMLEQMRQYATEEEHDVYTEEGMKKEIQKQAALMLQEMMKPAQQQIMQEKRQMELDRFKSQNPDLTSPELKMPIAKLLMERPELKLEDAYYIVKSKVTQERAAQQLQEQSQRKANQRNNYKKTSTGRNVSPSGTPKFRSAWEAFQWHKTNSSKG